MDRHNILIPLYEADVKKGWTMLKREPAGRRSGKIRAKDQETGTVIHPFVFHLNLSP